MKRWRFRGESLGAAAVGNRNAAARTATTADSLVLTSLLTPRANHTPRGILFWNFSSLIITFFVKILDRFHHFPLAL